MHRHTWLEVDLGLVESNIRRIGEICQKKLIAVVKADGYGCGDIKIAEAAERAGVTMLAVSSADEALILRQKGYAGELLILGHTDAEDIPELIKQNISVPAYSLNWVKRTVNCSCKGLKVHLKVDTGMNRIGFHSIPELKEAIELLKTAGAQVTGIFTHFACADTDKEFTLKQFERFQTAVQALNHHFEWIHCDNSEATLWLKEDCSNACRIGISMYGISETLKDLYHPVSLYSRVFFIKQVHAGDTIGYGATYTAETDEYIGTMPIGYADGLIRKNQGRKVYINGSKAEIVGRVCMDQAMIRIDSTVTEGSKVEIFGPHISLEQMAEELDTIPYEILCLISDRVTRVYKRNGEIIDESNGRMKEAAG